MNTTKFFILFSYQNDLDFQALGAVRTTDHDPKDPTSTTWILPHSNNPLLQLSFFKQLIQATYPPQESYGDDAYFDYIPDALGSLLYMAAQISEATFSQTIDWIYGTYGHIYKDDEEGTINYALEDLPYYLEDIKSAELRLSGK